MNSDITSTSTQQLRKLPKNRNYHYLHTQKHKFPSKTVQFILHDVSSQLQFFLFLSLCCKVINPGIWLYSQIECSLKFLRCKYQWCPPWSSGFSNSFSMPIAITKAPTPHQKPGMRLRIFECLLIAGWYLHASNLAQGSFRTFRSFPGVFISSKIEKTECSPPHQSKSFLQSYVTKPAGFASHSLTGSQYWQIESKLIFDQERG